MRQNIKRLVGIVQILTMLSMVIAEFELVNFKFIYGKSPNIYETYYMNETTKLLKHEKFFNNKRTVFYIHGWIEKIDFGGIETVAKAYIQRNDHNIVIVDWGAYSDGEYFYAVLPRVIKIGFLLGRVFNKLFTAGLDVKRVHMVGHSFGAHMSGVAGRSLIASSSGKYKFKRITGLDAAGPGFFPPLYVEPLNLKDGEFVDIIHTDTFFIGSSEARGTVDFWINEGLQPSCPQLQGVFDLVRVFCSHRISWRYWAESVANKYELKFPAVKCDSWAQYNASTCQSRIIYMGVQTDTTESGNFFLETRAQAPFSISDVGFSKHNILNMNKNNNYLHLKSFVDQILIFQDRFLRGLIPKQSSNYLSSKETSDESFEYH